jgi:hypothetical protein
MLYPSLNSGSTANDRSVKQLGPVNVSIRLQVSLSDSSYYTMQLKITAVLIFQAFGKSVFHRTLLGDLHFVDIPRDHSRFCYKDVVVRLHIHILINTSPLKFITII